MSNVESWEMKKKENGFTQPLFANNRHLVVSCLGMAKDY